MKKIKFKAYLSVSFAGCDREEEFEILVDDDATEQDIENEKELVATEWAYNYISLSYD